MIFMESYLGFIHPHIKFFSRAAKVKRISLARGHCMPRSVVIMVAWKREFVWVVQQNNEWVNAPPKIVMCGGNCIGWFCFLVSAKIRLTIRCGKQRTSS